MDELRRWINSWIESIKYEAEKYIEPMIDRAALEDLTKEDLINVIYDLVGQHCCDYDSDECDSRALTSDAEAIAVLSFVGLFDLESAVGRRAIGKIKKVG